MEWFVQVRVPGGPNTLSRVECQHAWQAVAEVGRMGLIPEGPHEIEVGDRSPRPMFEPDWPKEDLVRVEISGKADLVSYTFLRLWNALKHDHPESIFHECAGSDLIYDRGDLLEDRKADSVFHLITRAR